jgi:hypothetical protein
MQRTCNTQEMIAMKEKGFSVDDINNMCTSYKVKEESIQAVADVMKTIATNPRGRAKQDGFGEDDSSPRGGQTMTNPASFGSALARNSAASCTTLFGSCPLGTPAPAGLACHCQTSFGAIPGVTQ